MFMTKQRNTQIRLFNILKFKHAKLMFLLGGNCLLNFFLTLGSFTSWDVVSSCAIINLIVSDNGF